MVIGSATMVSLLLLLLAAAHLAVPPAPSVLVPVQRWCLFNSNSRLESSCTSA
jgi:hypothetical protein